jgi:hypothetical protein
MRKLHEGAFYVGSLLIVLSLQSFSLLLLLSRFLSIGFVLSARGKKTKTIAICAALGALPLLGISLAP